MKRVSPSIAVTFSPNICLASSLWRAVSSLSRCSGSISINGSTRPPTPESALPLVVVELVSGGRYGGGSTVSVISPFSASVASPCPSLTTLTFAFDWFTVNNNQSISFLRSQLNYIRFLQQYSLIIFCNVSWSTEIVPSSLTTIIRVSSFFDLSFGSTMNELDILFLIA